MVIMNQDMLSIKQKLLDFLENQPDDLTSDDIIDFLLVNDKIEAGISAIQRGEFKTLEQAREYFRKWLE